MATPTTVINVKTPKLLKKQAQQLADELGVPLTTVINVQLKQFVRDRMLHIEADLHPTPYLKKVIDRAEKDWSAGRNYSGPFTTAEEIEDHLRSL